MRTRSRGATFKQSACLISFSIWLVAPNSMRGQVVPPGDSLAGQTNFIQALKVAKPAPMSPPRGVVAETSPGGLEHNDVATGQITHTANSNAAASSGSRVTASGKSGVSIAGVPSPLREGVGAPNSGVQATAVSQPTAITNTYSHPWNTVFKLLIRFTANNTNYYYVCSASSLSSFHLLTAGHCLYNHDIADNGSNIAGWAQEVWAWPAQTDLVGFIGAPDFPYGVAKVTFQTTYTAWIQNQDVNWDIAWMAMDRRIGDHVGWMGREANSTTASLNFDGYPSEEEFGFGDNNFQYWGFDVNNVQTYTANRILLNAYAYGGQSGGPVWRYDGTDRWIQGVNSTSNRAGKAEATRMALTTFNDIAAAIVSDETARPPVARPYLVEYVFSTNAKALLTSNAAPGGSFTITYNVFNSGFAATSANLSFYLSPVPQVSSAAVLVGTQFINNLNAFSYLVQNATFTVPTSIAPGKYYVVWTWSSGVLEYPSHINSPSILQDKEVIIPAQLTVAGAADLKITKTHSGNFTQGQTGATYSIVVSNIGQGSTNGDVTVKETLPIGLTATSILGPGWACDQPAGPCSPTDPIVAGSTYPPITLRVNVAANAPPTVTNTVSVSGGGDSNTSNNSASDPTTIMPPTQSPVLKINKTHIGDFAKGQTGATYTVTVSNTGQGSTAGVVTVTDTLPGGLTATSINGSGWNCAQPSGPCSRSDVLAAGASYPNLTVIVNVASNASSPQVNAVNVSGGGSAGASASDSTNIVTGGSALTITSPAALPPGKVGVPYSQTISATGGSGSYTWSATGLPAGLSIGGSSGVITGTPTSATGSPFQVVVKVTDGASASATKTYSLIIEPATSGTGVLLGVGNGSGGPGQTIEVPVQISTLSGSAPAACAADVNYDSQKLTYVSSRIGESLVNAGKDLQTTVQPNNDVRLLGLALTNTSPIGNGNWAYVKFTLSSGFTSGSTTVSLKSCQALDAQLASIETSCTSGTISAGCSCDVNGDGQTNLADIGAVIQQFLNNTQATCHGGSVNLGDIGRVINAFLGKGCTQ